jgi:hypothetical protein
MSRRAILIALLLSVGIARADEIQCPRLYCWSFLPGQDVSCSVRYELATERCRSSCAGYFPGPVHKGNTHTTDCPGLPDLWTVCLDYIEVEPNPEPSAGSLPGTLFTANEAYGACYYVPPQ